MLYGFCSKVEFIKFSGISKIYSKLKGFEKYQLCKIDKELKCGDFV